MVDEQGQIAVESGFAAGKGNPPDSVTGDVFEVPAVFDGRQGASGEMPRNPVLHSFLLRAVEAGKVAFFGNGCTHEKGGWSTHRHKGITTDWPPQCSPS